MTRIVKSHLDELPAVCRQRHVSRLALFGSAVHGRFRKGTSDVDVLVEFDSMPPVKYADSYFGLQDDLQQLFGAPVDLIERAAIRNPYFKEAVEQSCVVVYEKR